MNRYCKQIFILSGLDEFPYSLRGSGTAVNVDGRHLLFCCGHQFEDSEPDTVAIVPSTARQVTITASGLRAVTPMPGNAGEEILDVRCFEFMIENYALANLTADFFLTSDDEIWPKAETGHFFLYGYPSSLQEVHYGDENARIAARTVEVSAKYDGPSNSSYVHRVAMQRTQHFDADGLSGAPLFYLGGKLGSYFVGWAGMIIRGSAQSDFLHFVEAGFLRSFANRPGPSVG